MIEPEHFTLRPSGPVPNNPWLPVLLYRGVLAAGTPDPVLAMEALFGRNGWPAQWRNGIYDWHHYHAEAHEVLGIARGGAEVLLGGPQGRRISVAAGDVLVLPAGTGHCNLTPGAYLRVIGAYAPGAICDMQEEALAPEAIAHMRTVPFPRSDPVSGPDGPLVRLWSSNGP